MTGTSIPHRGRIQERHAFAEKVCSCCLSVRVTRSYVTLRSEFCKIIPNSVADFCCRALTFVCPKAHTHKHTRTGDWCFMPRCFPQGNHQAVTHTRCRHIQTHTPCLHLLTLYRQTDRFGSLLSACHCIIRASQWCSVFWWHI